MKAKKTTTSGASRRLAGFLRSWRDRRFSDVGAMLQKTYLETMPDGVEWTESVLSQLPIASWSIVRRIVHSPVLIEFNVRLVFADGVRPIEVRRIMLICESGAYTPDKNGTWGVNPVSLLAVIGEAQ